MRLRKRVKELEERVAALEPETTRVGCEMPPRYKIKSAEVDAHSIWRAQVADHSTAWGGEYTDDDWSGYL